MLHNLPHDLPHIVSQLAWPFVRFEALRYLIVASAMAGLLLVFAWPRIQRRRPVRSDYRRELLASLRTSAVFAAVGLVTIWGQQNGWLAGHVLDASAAYIALSLLGLILFHDTWFYWTHRAMHDRRIFPWMHRLHHRSVAPTPFAAYAFSTSEAVVQAIFFPIWMIIVPMPIGSAFAFMLFMIVRNVMGHAGHELHPRGWVDHPVLQWVNTTVHHDLHHSGNFGCNYGLYFTWWDRICGTEHPEYRARFRALTERPTTVAVGA